MYITRFSHRLDFGEKTHDVSVTAMRLVSRMKRDWLHTGRRPSGLCGAALLVAARLHGFNCELNDVVKVVKIGHETIRKRLTEFESTPSSQLTINEFMNIDLEAEHDPPAFYNARIRSKIQQLEAEAGGMINIESEIGKISHAIDDQIAQNLPETNPLRRPASPVISQSIVGEADDTEIDPVLKASASFVHSENPQVLAATFMSPPRSGRHTPAGSTQLICGPKPTVQSLGLGSNEREVLKKSVTNRKRTRSEDGELDLEGIDDEEIEKLLLTPRESEIKARIWNMEFGEFLKELEEKRAKRLEEEKKKSKTARKPRARRKDYYGESKSAEEAIEKLVSRQRLSNKIDYEALRKATAEDEITEKIDSCQTPATGLSAADSVQFVPLVEITTVSLENKEAIEVVHESEDQVADETEPQADPPIVHETRTVSQSVTNDEEEYDEDEDDYEENACVSASQLLQQAGMAATGYDGYGYEGDDYY